MTITMQLSITARRVLVISTTLLAVSVWGSIYSFPVWLPALKQRFGLSQSWTDFVGTMVYVGINMLGMAISVPIKALGKRGLLLATACCLSLAPLGYSIMWMEAASDDLVALERASEHGGLAVLCCAVLFLGVSTGVVFGLMMDASFREFDQHTMPVIAAFTNTFFAAGGVVSSVLAARLPLQPFLGMLAVAHALPVLPIVGAFYLLLFSAKPTARITSRSGSGSGSGSGESDVLAQQALLPRIDPESQPLGGDGVGVGVAADERSGLIAKPKETPRQVLAHLSKTPEFWAVTAIAFFTVGTGAGYTSNMGLLAQAVDGPGAVDRSGEVVAIFNSAQLGGRLLVALVSAALFRWTTVSPVIPVAIYMSSGYALLILLTAFYVTPANLMTLMVLYGLPYGAMWCILGNLTELTSRPQAEYWGVINGYVIFPMGGLGAFVANSLIGYFFDQEADSHHACYYPARDCYGTAFKALGCGMLLVLALTLWLHGRTTQAFASSSSSSSSSASSAATGLQHGTSASRSDGSRA